MKHLFIKTSALLGVLVCSFASMVSAESTMTLLDLDFDSSGSSFPAWGSPALTGSPGEGASTIQPTLPGDPGFDSGLFATAPASGYLALTSDASAVDAGTFWGGWASNVTLATINSLYTAG